jgi:hypothetical protein
MIGKYMLGRTRRWEEIIMMGPRGTGCKVRWMKNVLGTCPLVASGTGCCIFGCDHHRDSYWTKFIYPSQSVTVPFKHLQMGKVLKVHTTIYLLLVQCKMVCCYSSGQSATSKHYSIFTLSTVHNGMLQFKWAKYILHFTDRLCIKIADPNWVLLV